jgi:hypothetical protein
MFFFGARKQGDQIGQIFASWAVFSWGIILKITEKARIF